MVLVEAGPIFASKPGVGDDTVKSTYPINDTVGPGAQILHSTLGERIKIYSQGIPIMTLMILVGPGVEILHSSLVLRLKR